MLRFFKECAIELKKITWPTRDAVASSTKVMLISTLVFMLLFLGVDNLIQALVLWFLGE